MEYEDDAHFCLKCHSTILGLENYVNHRKSSCSKSIVEPSKSPLPSQLLPPDEIGLKADDFFSSLELRSSSKKPAVQSTSGKNFSGILTRSKISAAIQATQKDQEPSKSGGKNVWIGGNQLKDLGTGDNQSKLIKAVANLERHKNANNNQSPPRLGAVYEDSEEDSAEDYNYDDDESSEEDYAPPRNYTGGKWKPSSPVQWNNRGGGDWNVPPPTFTGGKWKPSPTYTKGKWKPSEDDNNHPVTGGKYPPPGHTKGKWKPKSDIEDDRYPPATHTKGKWKPKEEDNNLVPPPSHTKGKWKPKLYEEAATSPPVTHTKGKWKPKLEIAHIEKEKSKLPPNESCTKDKSKTVDASSSTCKTIAKVPKPSKSRSSSKTLKTKQIEDKNSKNVKISDDSPFRKSSGTIQYWCSTCSRRLASKIVYERHLKSHLHFKRAKAENDFDDDDDDEDGAIVKKIKLEESNIAPVVVKTVNPFKKRNRRKFFEICIACRSKVNRYLIGKHLISHYHYRKGDITSEASKKLVLDNILSIILESPFQCSLCKFYCNTHEQFLNHWKSDFHLNHIENHHGYFLCAFCKHQSQTSEEMFQHLTSAEHLEVVSVINKSVPITIKKIQEIACLSCQKTFLLNIQLLSHCRLTGHDSSNVSIYNENDYNCSECNKTFSKAISLQRHFRKKHRLDYYFCGICNIKFKSNIEAKQHRITLKHRYASLEKKKPKSLKRKCQYCEQYFNNFLLLKEHLQSEHPDHKIRCPLCGAHFIVAQELSNHLRAKLCKFPENSIDHHEYRCDICPFSSDSMSELLFHVALHGDPLIVDQVDGEENQSNAKSAPRYKCPLCEKFYPKHSLQPHLRLHTKERPYTCKTCEATFTRKNNLLYHEKNHERKRVKPKKELKEDTAFLCSTCGAGFNRKFTLQQHMLTHTGKLCRCPQLGCFYTARKMSELQEHFKTHSSEKNFACDLCDYKGKTKKQLKRHMTVHDETKKYSCSLCSFTSRTSAHLKRHVRLHTGAKPFKCPYCEYKCNNMENLRRHVLSTTKHPGKYIYECKFCKQNQRFQTNVAKDFKAHLILNHREEFGNTKNAATYVAGIYEADEDNTYLIDVEENLDDPSEHNIIPKTDEIILKLNTNEDPVVAPAMDQMLPMFIIPKDDTTSSAVEIASDSWNLIGRYDVEESGALVPFQSGEDEELFQEHF